jgi:hypothetical protein
MKFLCVPCDSPMKLQSVGPPERGSLSVVYSCPECGYEMAMLTNAYETQVVQSLGVRIGPESSGESVSASGARCPFTAMIPGMEGARPLDGAQSRPGQVGAPGARTLRGGVEVGAGGVEIGEAIPVRWTPAAEARLVNIPEFVRPMARVGIEKFARENGSLEVDEKILDAARDFFGM